MQQLSTLFRFITAYEKPPVWGMETPISVKFLLDGDNKIMPEALDDTCIKTIFLSVVHSGKNIFYKYMNKALDLESMGFGGES